MRLAEVSKGVEIGGQFRLVDILGNGSFGQVWLADVIAPESELPPQVALKIFSQQDRADKALFKEAQNAGPFDHESLVKVFGCERIDGLAVMWMEYVPGKALDKMVGEEAAPLPLPLETILVWLRDVAEGLAYLHDQQPPFVHGDLKLDNILVDDAGGARLTDFGQSRTIDDLFVSTDGGGGFFFLAPEALASEDSRGKRCVQSDIYSFGVVAYRLLCGRLPHQNTQQILSRTPFPNPRDLNPSVPEGLDKIVMQCLEKRPADRFASGAALLAAIEMYAEEAAVEKTETVEVPSPQKEFVRTPADELAEAAGAKLEAGDAEEVAGELEKAIQHMSTSPKVLLVYAAAAKRVNKFEVAQAMYRRVIRWMDSNGWSDEEKQEAYEGLGDVAVRMKGYEESVRSFEWLLERWPKKDWYRYRLGVAHGLAGRYKKSIETLEPLTQAEPSALICAKIGYAYYQDRQIDAACQYFNEALMLDALEPTALSCLVEIRAVQGQVDKAHLYLDRLRQVEGMDHTVARLEKQLPARAT
ncbi:MAG: protein kinase [Verrucomicrobiales bacterium]|nr:protein kinase [Verrucomicrobiales bacterium]